MEAALSPVHFHSYFRFEKSARKKAGDRSSILVACSRSTSTGGNLDDTRTLITLRFRFDGISISSMCGSVHTVSGIFSGKRENAR